MSRAPPRRHRRSARVGGWPDDRQINRNDRRSIRNSNRRHAAQLPRPKGLRDERPRGSKAKSLLFWPAPLRRPRSYARITVDVSKPRKNFPYGWASHRRPDHHQSPRRPKGLGQASTHKARLVVKSVRRIGSFSRSSSSSLCASGGGAGRVRADRHHGTSGKLQNSEQVTGMPAKGVGPIQEIIEVPTTPPLTIIVNGQSGARCLLTAAALRRLRGEHLPATLSTPRSVTKSSWP